MMMMSHIYDVSGFAIGYASMGCTAIAEIQFAGTYFMYC
jgi:pyruvate/2-oxoglutarate/acetoin dehydrogenase E1 component